MQSQPHLGTRTSKPNGLRVCAIAQPEKKNTLRGATDAPAHPGGEQAEG